ncbi:restriction endonuclease subunit S [Weissella confusa]|nr:restriction endonuclease subunit S [Weissella confusa]MCS9989357.1 restriction endonuclease subunit S [Weissella confusa]
MSNKVPQIRFNGYSDAWVQRKLGELMDVSSVKRIHQSDWTSSGVPFYRARDIVAKAKGKEIEEPIYISQDKYDEYSAVSGKVQPGDLLVTGVGTIGIPLLIDGREPLYFKDGNIIWFKNHHAIDGSFFFHQFRSQRIQKFIKDVAGIGTVGTYTIDSGKKTPFNLPVDEAEQQKVGQFFDELDNLIAANQRKLDLLKEQKKGYLQKMFPKNGAKVPELRFAGFADDWQECKLGEHAKYRRGSFPQPYGNKEWYDGEGAMPFVQVVDVTNKLTLVENTKQKISKLAQSKSVFVPKGTVVVTLQGSIGRVAITQYDSFVDRTLLIFEDYEKETDERFWAYTIQKKFEIEKLKAPGGTIKTITKEALSSFDVHLPQFKEQAKIGSFFKQLDDTIDLHQRKLDLLKEQKKGFLQKMFV